MAVAQIDSAQPAPFQDTSRRDPAARIKPVRCGRSGRIHRSAVGGARGPTSAHGPVWLELYLEIANVSAEDDRTAYSWFEGSVSPWVDVQRPVVVWDDAEAALADFGLKAPDPATADDPGTLDATRALALLPHLYSLGTNRVVQELLRKGCKACVNGVEPEAQEHEPASAGPSSNGSPPDPIELFPLIGFHPERNGTPGLHFKTLRTNVAVIGETIVTVRLPDLPCPPEPRRDDPALSAEERGTWEALEIPSRFFPCWDAKARDFAEEIARHQAATGRALSDEVRMAMEPCTEAAPKGDSRGARVPDEEKIDELVRLGEAVEMADRQLSRVLRRLGSFGEEGGDGRASRGLSAASEIRRRYHYAVDEIRTLEKELDPPRARRRTHMDSRFQASVAFAGSAILIPTLVAGIFGANVWLPGERHTEGLFALLLFIVAFAAGGGVPPHPP